MSYPFSYEFLELCAAGKIDDDITKHPHEIIREMSKEILELRRVLGSYLFKKDETK